MNALLTGQLDEIIASSNNARSELSCESQLRVAATMLSRATAADVSATAVVGTLGRDDVPAIEALVARIGDELDLDGRLHLHVGSFSVRFTRRTGAELET